MSPLWNAAEAARAVDCADPDRVGNWQAESVSIDSRQVGRGALFVALRGPNHDAHAFVGAALAQGAAAAMVDQAVPGLGEDAPLLRVRDTMAGLEALGRAGRDRSAARIAAVTGSVGKTGTKEALRLALSASGNSAASAGSLNNHWGTPLSLARLPREAEYGVFELGMNHAGEIAALTRMVRPDVAVVTTIEPAHLGHFASVEAIADAKAEIFLGLEPGGTAVLNRDNPHFDRLAAAARAAGAAILGFGSHPEAHSRLVGHAVEPRGSRVEAEIGGRKIEYRLPLPGRHWVMNSLAVLAACAALGADLTAGAAALAALEALPGRGRRYDLPWRDGTLTLLDESYNASPASMRAALAVLAEVTPAARGRRIAVLGDMLELGSSAPALHAGLAPAVSQAGVDRVFLIGPAMAALDAALPTQNSGGLWPDAESVIAPLLAYLRPGDVVTVKSSLAMRTGRIVERLRTMSEREN